ncbi:DUF4307 domain-containing protein [Acidipropionibacterium acidipropionici]|jgi:hypothetical protein|uniref:Uncharacterized protein n=2 Tax=Acidipropionibacterium acidipropionici TaxID=1748 RepID=A0A142KKF5_9ACTN|nr:hypothetical protein PACID_10400 [Acidipropionibacterium acidipropionici ATCC 4875]ALN16534.1 hypothetical protein ASQ49_16010 [Acidipropionibacterium acidipropionici]AMS06593.1 hypothetical protein AXH35_15260 [Acidipropionibacterium acidipropionici]AOZ45380.1 hypothetical protein A8L58_00195 [Acidipropionibacterium acidipropionici]APZ10414.1 hypothetical protein BWX38_15490 [Acidipropionibacterium acidipropionici]
MSPVTHGATQPGGRRLSPQEQERLAQRYPQRRRRLWIPLACLAAALLVGWTVWSGLHHSAEPMRVQLFGYQVVDATRVDVTVDVHRSDPSVSGSCTLYALSHDNQRVGEAPLRISPAGDQDVRIRAHLKTFSRAVTAQLENCQASR